MCCYVLLVCLCGDVLLVCVVMYCRCVVMYCWCIVDVCRDVLPYGLTALCSPFFRSKTLLPDNRRCQCKAW